MMWSEGLLIKLDELGAGGGMFKWVQHFLVKRQIQEEHGSSVYGVEDGTPNGALGVPMLCSIIIDA